MELILLNCSYTTAPDSANSEITLTMVKVQGNAVAEAAKVKPLSLVPRFLNVISSSDIHSTDTIDGKDVIEYIFATAA